MDAITTLSRADWAKRISDDYDEARERFFGIGDNLVAAKEALAHGEFQLMVDAELPFSRSTAQRFMAIAQDGRLRNAAHATLLPADYTVLASLAGFDDKTFEKALQDGVIRPDLTRADLTRFKSNQYVAANTALSDGCRVEDLEGLVADGKRYGVISADMPWEFESWSDKGKSRNPDQQYGTLTLEEIRALPVADLAAENCVLLLWVVGWIAPADIQAVGEAYGFTYSSRAYDWVKTTKDGDGFPISGGAWTRGGAEDVWLFTKGAPARRSKGERQVIWWPRGEHSEKPGTFYESARRLADGPYLALFERQIRPGWTCFGNEISRQDMEAGL